MFMTNLKARKLTAMAVACVFATNTMAMSMQELFDGVNAQSNISSPAVVQGQTMNMLTGGSMFMRAPKRTYNLAMFTPPSWNAGCGGIDLFAGGFSFINKEQFVAMLRNIGSNALGYGFKLAIQNLCPTCDNVMQALQATAQAINRQNVDSCEAAKGIVNAAIPDTWTRDKQNSAKNFGVDTGLFSDITDAWTNVMNNEGKANDTINSVASSKPEVKDAMPSGNIVWKALKKVDGIDDDYRELLMSMVGTTIFRTDSVSTPDTKTAKTISIEDFIGGNMVDADGNPLDSMDFVIYKCDERVDCLNPYDAQFDPTHTKKSFKAMIRAKINTVINNLRDRAADADPAGTMKFLNATDIPIYKIVAVTTSLGNTTMADNAMNRYQELIAAKYAQVYIQRAVMDLREALAKYRSVSGPAASQEASALEGRMNDLEKKSRDVLQQAYAQTVSTYNIAQEVAYMERAMTSNMSQTLRASLAFGKSIR